MRDLLNISDSWDVWFDLAKAKHKHVTGKMAERALEWSGITTNKNMVPGDKNSPFVTSGIRIGTPALTTRGMGPDEMKQIAKWIDSVIKDPENKEHRRGIRNEVKEMASQFPHFKW